MISSHLCEFNILYKLDPRSHFFNIILKRLFDLAQPGSRGSGNKSEVSTLVSSGHSIHTNSLVNNSISKQTLLYMDKDIVARL